jgi:hypothetical protein
MASFAMLLPLAPLLPWPMCSCMHVYLQDHNVFRAPVLHRAGHATLNNQSTSGDNKLPAALPERRSL